MSKRKPLPYAAAAQLDDARMALAQAERQLRPLIDTRDLETVARCARALDCLRQAERALGRIEIASELVSHNP